MLILPLVLFAQADGNYKVENRSLKQVLNDLEKKYSIYFSFNPDELKNQKITYSGTDNSLEGILEAILDNTALVFEKVKDQFYVIKRPESLYLDLAITDDETGAPLPYATLRLKGTSLGQVADDQGRLKLVISNPKGAILEVSYLGFQTQEIDLESINKSNQIKINLKPEPIDLNDFEIKEYINVGIASDPKANSFRILPQQMEILPGLSERDVLLSAQIISGLTSNDESASGINIRGSAPDNTLLYWNNVPIYHTAHYFGNISSFIPSSIGSVDIYKNYIPVRYGGATAGLVSIFSRNEIDAETKAEASVNMTHADAYVKLPFRKDLGSFMVAFRRSYNDAVPTWTFNSYGTKLFGGVTSDQQGVFQTTEDEDDFNNDLSFSDINLQWNYQPSGRSLFEASFVRSKSQFDYREFDPEEDINLTQSHNIRSLGANIGWTYRLRDDYSIRSTLSVSDYDMSYALNNIRDVVLGEDIISRSNNVSNVEFRLINKWQRNEKEVLEFGYQMNHLNVKNLISENVFFEEDEAIDLRSNGFINALFADYNYKPNDQLEAVFSGRFSNISTLGASFFSPQVKLNYSPNEKIILKSSLGIYHQYLSTIQESELTLSNAVERHWLIADDNEDEEDIPAVPIIVNRQATLGMIYNANSWLVDLDFYVKDIDGILAKNQGFDLVNEEGFENGFERLYGIDLTVRKRWKYFRSWFSYNFQDSQVELESISPDPFPSSFNIRHQLRLSTTYNWKKWEFSLGYIFKTGLPVTEITDLILVDPDGDFDGGTDDDDEEEESEEDDIFYDITYTEPNERRLPNYHRVDFSVWHKFGNDKTKLKGEIGLSMINVLNRRNTFNKSYSVDFDRNDNISIIERTKFFLRFTPNISVRIWF